MTQQDSIPTRTALGIAAAACSLTLAAGITGAALLGYLAPRERSLPSGAPQEAPAATADLTSPTSGVVLVPVQTAPAAPAVDAGGGEADGMLLAAARHGDGDEHFRGSRREHRGDEHDDD